MKFSELGLQPTVQAGVDAVGFVECTPIQAAAIPHILAGRDIAGLAQTGTGKTAAFVLPLIERIILARNGVTAPKQSGEGASANAVVNEGVPSTQDSEIAGSGGGLPTTSISRVAFADWRPANFILVLVPTRELAEQVCENVKKYGSGSSVRAAAIYGGTGYEGQKAAIKNGYEFIVATPGRLIDLYKEHLLDLGQVRAIVFDEADRMFDMGFKDDMKYILRRVPQDRQFLVFSATLNFDVLNTAYEFGANPIEVNVSRDQAKADNVIDEIFHVGSDDKPKYLLSLLQKIKPQQVIIFSNFKHNVDRIAKFLSANGLPAMGISSLISQHQRTRIMELFRNTQNDRNILVATDVAARGLDIKGVDLVINYELPDDAENYVHRIGRTGRAGASGYAVSLVSDRDVEALQRIENYLHNKVKIGWIEDSELVQDFKPLTYDEERRNHNRHTTGVRSGFSKRNDSRGGHAGGGRSGGYNRGARGRVDRGGAYGHRDGQGHNRPRTEDTVNAAQGSDATTPSASQQQTERQRPRSYEQHKNRSPRHGNPRERVSGAQGSGHEQGRASSQSPSFERGQSTGQGQRQHRDWSQKGGSGHKRYEGGKSRQHSTHTGGGAGSRHTGQPRREGYSHKPSSAATQKSASGITAIKSFIKKIFTKKS